MGDCKKPLKIFLSVPMKNREKEDIERSLERMKSFARLIFDGEEIEFINTIVKEKAPEGVDERVWYLGESIKLLSQADALVSVDVDGFDAPGVLTEQFIFLHYKGKHNAHLLPPGYVMSKEDVEKSRNSFSNFMKTLVKKQEERMQNHGK